MRSILIAMLIAACLTFVGTAPPTMAAPASAVISQAAAEMSLVTQAAKKKKGGQKMCTCVQFGSCAAGCCKFECH